MDFCWSRQLAVANTLFSTSPNQKVTYHETNAHPMDRITATGFSMLDLILVPATSGDELGSTCSDRETAFASHHFPVRATINCNVIPGATPKQIPKLDWAALQDPNRRRQILHEFPLGLLNDEPKANLDDAWSSLCTSVGAACAKHLPLAKRLPNKPWISDATLALLDKRREARLQNNWDCERMLRKQVRQSAARDRARWLQALTSNGDWDAMKMIRKGRRAQQGRLRDTGGRIVSSEERAETLAEHLEKVQWEVRPTSLTPGSDDILREPLPVSLEPFAHPELRKAIRKMRNGKAAKPDDVRVEFFKALADEPGPVLDWLLDFCNGCWQSKRIPAEWANACVSMIFKKGDPADCNNYRPICIQTVANKLFATMVKQRLLDAGVDSVLWPSQFGFRPNCCTEDAIYIARRRIELAKAQRNGQISLLALDWKKAFDSISPTSLIDSLRRFGIPSEILDMISGMLLGRTFSVRDCGACSSTRGQQFGITQGCTLSPLLFVMAMSVLLHDAVALLGPGARNAYDRGDLADIVYADDTLLMGVSDTYVTEYLRAVMLSGSKYGMELHFGKFQLLPVRCQPRVALPDGDMLAAKKRMEYLGTVLTDDVHDSQELARRIAMAKADFIAIEAVW